MSKVKNSINFQINMFLLFIDQVGTEFIFTIYLLIVIRQSDIIR